MICACTLNRLERNGALATAPSLANKWNADLETAYRAGTGNPDDDAEDHDKAREATRFEGVYQAFGAPDPWNRVKFQTQPMQVFSDGKVVLEQASSVAPVYQDTVRKTLPWVPFKTDDGAATFESEMMAPQVWLYNRDEDRMVAADQAGMSVAALQNDWGVRLVSKPNHLLARNHWESMPPLLDPAESATEPKYDYDQMAATIAFETDQRLGDGALVFERVGGVRPQDGTLDLIDEDAELWFAAPGTAYGVDAAGGLLKTGAGAFTVLRNDGERLRAVLAGAIARYFYNRVRADIVLKGLFPYSLLVGKILTVIEESGDSRSIRGAITAVEYQGGESPKTVIRAGYAR
jgi:hypothetical protein